MTGPNLLGVAFGWEPSRELVEAIDREVFRCLDPTVPKPARRVAAQCGMDEPDMEVLLDALAALGFVAYSDEGYTCPNPIPDEMLEVASIFGAPELVRMAWTSDHAPGAMMDRHPFWDIFARKFHGIAEPNAARFATEISSPWVERCGVRRVLDVGASHGLYGLHMAKQYPKMEVTLLDWSDPKSGTDPLDQARANADKMGVSDRVKYVDGSLWDVLWDKSSEGQFDLMIWSALIHHFVQKDWERLCRRAPALFANRGVLAIQDFITEHRDPAQTPFAYEFRAFMRRFTGKAPSLLLRRDLEGVLADSGFTDPAVAESVIWPASWLIAEYSGKQE
jgi:2-polyprenyl-3-methyl-5-hydroxy-6-metoxy-1,4-benzoquinol methylase